MSASLKYIFNRRERNDGNENLTQALCERKSRNEALNNEGVKKLKWPRKLSENISAEKSVRREESYLFCLRNRKCMSVSSQAEA